MATCNGRIDVGRYAIEIKFVHIDRLADAIINQTLYCLSWYNNRLSTAVYNFMQTQKTGNPVKSRLPLQIKEARDGARGPGDLGLRGPERSVDIELPSPGRARKKERYRFGIVLFSSARRGSNYTIVRKPSKYKEESTLPNRWVQTGCNHILIIQK